MATEKSTTFLSREPGAPMFFSSDRTTNKNVRAADPNRQAHRSGGKNGSVTVRVDESRIVDEADRKRQARHNIIAHGEV